MWRMRQYWLWCCVLLSATCFVAALPPSAFFDLKKGNYNTCYAGNAKGVCVFSLACTYGGGTHLGICRDRFYFASCCKVNYDDDLEEDKPEFEAVEAEIEEKIINDEVCGLRATIPESVGRGDLFRIVGGNSSSFGMWPWQASLMVVYPGVDNIRQRCGAVVIGKNWAATAAHCVRGFDPSDFLLRFGDHDRFSTSEPLPHVDRDVYEMFVHPKYDSVSYEYDIAILYFDKEIELSRHIRPICLPEPGDESAVIRGKASMGYVTGWGTLYEGGPKPEVLREAQLPVFDHRVCNKIFKLAGLDEKLSDTFICAGIEEGGTDACEGDSGGPLVMENPRTGRWILAGIVSWGNGCGERYQPGVYTNVAKLAGWIYDTVGEERNQRKKKIERSRLLIV